MSDWAQDCLKWRGRVLTGEYGHWCPEWDYMPVDETCSEFAVCTCHSPTDRVLRLREKQQQLIDEQMDSDKDSTFGW